MHRVARQQLPLAAAQAAVRGADPEFRVTAVLPRAGGEVNAVYEVRGARGARPLILKVYPERRRSPADRWRSKLAKEVFVYRLLARHGIERIPRVLHHEPAGTPELPSAYAVLSLLDGQPLSVAGTAAEQVYEEMGRLLASVHRITATHWGYLTTRIVDAKPSNAAYMLDQFATKLRRFADLGGRPALAAAMDRHVDRHADLLTGCRLPALCHNDFHDGNVLVARAGQAWRLTGLVDVENSVVADPLLDLARTDYHALRGDPARRRAFLRGYGLLPAGWDDRVALYRLHHALEFWNWSAATGKRRRLAGIAADLEESISGAPAPR